MANTTLNGVNIHYRIDGPVDAPTILFSNSLGTDLHMWDPVVDLLKSNWRCLRYDTRGHGKSAIVAGPYTIEILADDAYKLVEYLELSQVHFCGLSLGGLTGQRLALTLSHRLKSLTLANTAAHIPSEQAWNDRISSINDKGIKALSDGMMSRWFSGSFPSLHPDRFSAMKTMFERCDAAGYVAACAAVRDADFRAQLSDITLPTLIIAGLDDVATPLEMAEALHDGISGSQLTTLKPAGHISSMEQPKAFADTLSDFLTRAEGDGK
ncbi:MAG: 3-oxoadipate enol-lactonase [Pseudomonadota bacterium]